MKNTIRVFFVFIMALGMMASVPDMASAKTWAIESNGNYITAFTDPTEPVTPQPVTIENASLVLTWTEGKTGPTGGFSNIKVITFPGGIYEVELNSVVSSTDDTLTGRWKVTKNDDTVVTNAVGTATGLNGGVGSEITIDINSGLGNWVINAIINHRFEGILLLDEIRGSFMVNGTGLSGVRCEMIYWDPGPAGTGNQIRINQNTDSDGKYRYIDIAGAQFDKMTHKFKNNDPDLAMTISGYIFADNMPLADAEVEVVDEYNNVLFYGTTNEQGYFSSNTDDPIFATGQIKVTIKKQR